MEIVWESVDGTIAWADWGVLSKNTESSDRGLWDSVMTQGEVGDIVGCERLRRDRKGRPATEQQ